MNRRWPDFLAQAVARYPMEPPQLALAFYMSDRRAAGMGALEGRFGKPSGPVRNRKWMDVLHSRVHYHLTIDYPSRLEYPALVLTALSIDGVPDECITLTRVPAVFIERCLQVDPRDFWTEQGRGSIARQLREARRQIRQERGR